MSWAVIVSPCLDAGWPICSPLRALQIFLDPQQPKISATMLVNVHDGALENRRAWRTV
jgi:hypothetical protein